MQSVWEPGVGAWSASLWKLWWHQGDWVARTGSKYPPALSGPTEWHVGVLYHLSSSSVDAAGHGKRPPEVQTGLLFTDKEHIPFPRCGKDSCLLLPLIGVVRTGVAIQLCL